jgi:enolase-phosphatase E1
MIQAVVLDIEGTTSSLAYVQNTLFPYSRDRLSTWISQPPPDAAADVAAVLDEVRTTIGRPNATTAEVEGTLRGWIDADVKATPLKTLQGLIWQDGFNSGQLVAHVYDDVPPALRRWTEHGASLHVYSSGSVSAQKNWFGHTENGNLLGFFNSHFDTRNPGPKTDPASYQKIAAQLAVEPNRILFCSDSRAELDAARAAGWHTLGVRRPDNSGVDLGDHPVAESFAAVDPDPAEATLRP